MSFRHFAVLLAASASIPAAAQTAPPPPPVEAKTTAVSYVKAAAMSDLYEITSSKIAVKKSPTPAVRKFAAMLITHHKKTTAATITAAKKAGLTPTPPTLDAGTKASIAELQNAATADFDQLYIGQQVPAHQAALDLHQSYAQGGDKAPLRASATSAILIVEQHLAAALKMQGGKTAPKQGM